LNYALDKHATEVYDGLVYERQRLIARRLFLALSERREAQDVRRPQRLCDLLDQIGQGAETVFGYFAFPSRVDRLLASDPVAAEAMFGYIDESATRVREDRENRERLEREVKEAEIKRLEAEAWLQQEMAANSERERARAEEDKQRAEASARMGRRRGGTTPPCSWFFRPYSTTVPPLVLHSSFVSDIQPFPAHSFFPLQPFRSAAVLHSALPLHALMPLHLTFPSAAGWTSCASRGLLTNNAAAAVANIMPLVLFIAIAS
jgi:hypothetical protein